MDWEVRQRQRAAVRDSGKGSVFSTLFCALKRQRQHAADVKFFVVVQVEVVVDSQIVVPLLV